MKTIFYFTADWCQPCKKVKPIVQEINRDIYPNIFQIIDVDIEVEMVKQFKINSVPTFILIKDGIEMKRLVGAQTQKSLLELIKYE